MQELLKVRKGTFQHIENELLDYHETRKAILRIKNDLLYASPSHENTGGGRSNLPSDPTGTIASLMVTHKQIVEMEKMVQAIENVVDRLPKEKRDVLTLWYWSKPRLHTWDGIANQIPCGARTAKRWRSEIVYAIAQELGWK